MIKLYLREGARWTRYHEAWIAENSIVEHWGRLGSTGQTREHERVEGENVFEALERVLATALERGFVQVPLEQHDTILVEHEVDEHGTPEDLDKRHALESRVNETLGWTGLGHCDGGDIGSGSMAVYCTVVDGPTAVTIVERDLAGTQFAGWKVRLRSGSESGLPPSAGGQPEALKEGAGTTAGPDELFSLFYCCYSTGDQAESSDPYVTDRDTMVNMALTLLLDESDFFGVTDDEGGTIQFIVTDDERVWMEILDVEKRGSYGKHISMAELERVLLDLALPISRAPYPDLEFQPWSGAD